MAHTVTLPESQTDSATVIAQVQETGKALIVKQVGKPSVAVLPLAEYERLVAQRGIESKTAWRQEQEHILQRELEAFARLKPELMKTHKGEIVAIHEGALVDSDRDKATLAKRVYAKLGYRTILMAPIMEQERIVYLRSPKRVRQ